MADIINFRRAKKAKARAVKTAEADANRIKHGVPKSERNLAQARVDKDRKTAEAHKLSKDDDQA
jgi:hypothetical protein